jgi:hypothetical protein
MLRCKRMILKCCSVHFRSKISCSALLIRCCYFGGSGVVSHSARGYTSFAILILRTIEKFLRAGSRYLNEIVCFRRCITAAAWPEPAGPSCKLPVSHHQHRDRHDRCWRKAPPGPPRASESRACRGPRGPALPLSPSPDPSGRRGP